MNGLTFTQSVLLALALGAVAAGIGLVILGLCFADNDERPNAGLDILDPRERGLTDDITEEQALAWADDLHAMLEADTVEFTGPVEDDPYEDWTYAPRCRDPDRPRDPYIAPSPALRSWGVPTPIPPRPIGPEPGTTTLEFGRITGHDIADGYGPAEHTIRLSQAGARLIQPAIGWVTR